MLGSRSTRTQQAPRSVLATLTRSAGWSPLLCTLAVVGCSGGSRDGTTSGFNDPSTGGPTADAGAGGDNSAIPGRDDGGGNGGDGNDDGSPGFEVDASFIWVANTDQGTVSKIDTRTLTELGRYLTSPLGQGKPSRTSVAQDGSVAVANRGGVQGQPSVEAGITKIYANASQCEDRNANGTIDTSTGKNDVRPWMEDECIAWYRPLDYWSNRPVAWAPVAAPDVFDEPAKLWTAGSSNCTNADCDFDVIRINGATGEIEDTVSITNLMGPDFVSGGGFGGGGFPTIPGLPTIPGIGGGVLTNYGPYGGASDAGGNFWLFTATTTHLVRIDAETLAAKSWAVPNANGYGITIDPRGRVFVCGSQGVSRFDPATETWESSSAAVTLGFNGCMVDGKQSIWVGGGGDSGDPGLHAFDIDSLALINAFNVGNVKGVSIDIDGFVWGVGGGSTGFSNAAYRLDPVSGDVKSYTGLDNPYSYSDMTGFGLKQAGVVEVL